MDSQIVKKEKKLKKYEKFMNSELNKDQVEEEKILKELEELKNSLQENKKATEDLLRLDEDNTNNNPGQSGPGDAIRSARTQKESNARMLVDFLIKSIKEKEAKLECPVCLVTAEAPIYMCPESHLIW